MSGWHERSLLWNSWTAILQKTRVFCSMHAIRSPFYWRILKKPILYSGFNNPYQESTKQENSSRFKQGGFFGFFPPMYCIQHCFNCHPSDSTVSDDAGIEPRTVATSALEVRRSTTRLDLIHTRLDLIHIESVYSWVVFCSMEKLGWKTRQKLESEKTWV
jgi:hypothetical protein